jgi:hypothetical protein
MFTVPSLHQNGGGPMGKLDDKVAVITCATSRTSWTEAVRSIGGNVIGFQGDACLPCPATPRQPRVKHIRLN